MKIDSSDSLSSQLESEIIEKVEEKPPVPAPPEPEAAASNEVKAMKIDSSDSLSSMSLVSIFFTYIRLLR